MLTNEIELEDEDDDRLLSGNVVGHQETNVQQSENEASGQGMDSEIVYVEISSCKALGTLLASCGRIRC